MFDENVYFFGASKMIQGWIEFPIYLGLSFLSKEKGRNSSKFKRKTSSFLKYTDTHVTHFIGGLFVKQILKQNLLLLKKVFSKDVSRTMQGIHETGFGWMCLSETTFKSWLEAEKSFLRKMLFLSTVDFCRLDVFIIQNFQEVLSFQLKNSWSERKNTKIIFLYLISSCWDSWIRSTKW